MPAQHAFEGSLEHFLTRHIRIVIFSRPSNRILFEISFSQKPHPTPAQGSCPIEEAVRRGG
jgi:hypothetical protein